MRNTGGVPSMSMLEHVWTTPEQANVRSEQAQLSIPGHTPECPLN
jgi:hypothetical protein